MKSPRVPEPDETGLGPVTAGIPKRLRRVSSRAAGAKSASSVSKPGVAATAAPSFEFSFRLKPREIARHLDRFVIGQDEAKKVLGTALCDHFQHVRLTLEGRPAPFYQKQNILLLGPTGVGKTHLIRSAADLIGVPFVKADATKFSETGYVGGDVDDLVRDLVRRAGGDIARAEFGIIYLDEIDKLAGGVESGGRDVSGRGVQTNLLKLLEDGEVPLVSPSDVNAQVQSALASARGQGGGRPDVISTRNILFVASGAFSGLEEIIRNRTGKDHRSHHSMARTSDFIKFGLEPEFVGRLPVRVACHPLDADTLFRILKESESSLLRQYERSFAAYGIRVSFRDDALRRIAEMALPEETGARGLATVLERCLRDFKFHLPSLGIRSFVVDSALVESPSGALRKLRRKKR